MTFPDAEHLHFIQLACPECAEEKWPKLCADVRWHDGVPHYAKTGRPGEAVAHRCPAWRIWQEAEAVREERVDGNISGTAGSKDCK